MLEEITLIRRSFLAFPPPAKGGPRVNGEIRGVSCVQLIAECGRNLGVTPIGEALERAASAGYDLIEVAPNADPPVCKILDCGRYRYEMQKSLAEARKNQKVVETKEIKLRPNIDGHDYQIKVKNLCRFLHCGHKVRVVVRFRGRELDHHELGRQLLEKMREDSSEAGKVELPPRLEGKMMVMIISPK